MPTLEPSAVVAEAETEAVECNVVMTKERKKDDSKSRLYYRFRTGTLILSTDDKGTNGWISKPVGITAIRTHVHTFIYRFIICTSRTRRRT